MVAIPVNVLVLLVFMHIYFKENREQTGSREFLVLNLAEESKLNHKAYSTLLVNEGRYVWFFNWGANVSISDRREAFY